MFQRWRWKMRQAEEALERGALDEARVLLEDSELREFLPAQKLLQRLGSQLVMRGQQRLLGGKSASGWRDLDAASKVGLRTTDLEPLRQELVEHARREIVQYLSVGEAALAIERLDELARRHVETSETRMLRLAAGKWLAARKLARKGQFVEAQAQLKAAAALAPNVPALTSEAKDYAALAVEHRRQSHELHRMLADENWGEALRVADELLERAPEDEPARAARRRGWGAVGTELVATRPGQVVRGPIVDTRMAAAIAADTRPQKNEMMQTSAGDSTPDARLLVWIDGVGGYLVCQGAQVVLGQPSASGGADIPILGDVSARHAIIHRSGEGYLLEALRPTRVGGREVRELTPLTHGAVIELGEGVRLRFLRPHALSGTARLEFVSGHRTQPRTDGVILLADTCVFGPGASSHVVCPKWERDLVLFRRGNQLQVRTRGVLEIDGQPCDGEGPVTAGVHVASDDVSLSFEAV